MVESSYKHNYEYLSIEEAKSIISGTFVQGTTSIGGELATKSDIDKLITAADKRLTSMVPSTAANNEFVCFFECVDNRVDPTGVHVTNIIIQVGQNQKIKYELTPSNATVDTCTYEITSGSDYVRITDGTVYADAVGEAVCKITINGAIESTFQISVIDNNTMDLDCDVIAIQNCGVEVGLYAMSHYLYSGVTNILSWHGDAIVNKCEIYGRDGYWSLINFDKLRQFYESIKNEQSQVKGKTVEQMCQSQYGPAIKIVFYDQLDESESQEVQQDEKRTYTILRLTKNTPSASIYYNERDHKVHISGYDFKESVSFSSMVHAANNYSLVSYYISNRTIVAENYFFINDDKWSTTNLVVPKDDQFIFKGYQTFPEFTEQGYHTSIAPVVDAELLNKKVNGATISGQIKINSIDGNTDISTINGYLNFIYSIGGSNTSYNYGDDENGVYSLTNIKSLPYIFDFKITRNGAYSSGLRVQPIYINTADKELIKVHDFHNDYNAGIVGEIN